MHTGAADASKASPLAIGTTVSPAGELWILGLNEHRQLFAQRSADEGRSWAPAQLLATGVDPIVAEGEIRPKIAFEPASALNTLPSLARARPWRSRGAASTAARSAGVPGARTTRRLGDIGTARHPSQGAVMRRDASRS